MKVRTVRLKQLTLSGFLGIDHNVPLELTDLRHANVFIGPNNAGKSIGFRLINLLRTVMTGMSMGDMVVPNTNIPGFDESFWWRRERQHPVKAHIVLELEDSDLDASIQPQIFTSDHLFEFEVVMNINEHLVVNPIVRGKDSNAPLLKRNRGIELFDPESGSYINSSFASASTELLRSAGVIISQFCQRLRFFDAVRSLERTGGPRAEDDGSTLVRRLHELQQGTKHAQKYVTIKHKTLSSLNEIAVTSGDLVFSDISVKGDEGGLTAFITLGDHQIYPLGSFGTGISQLFLICLSLAMDEVEKQGRIYFIEEPECNLHPALLKRLMMKLLAERNTQLLITTHSSVVMNSLSPEHAVFSNTRNKHGQCEAIRCKDFTDMHNVLDSLGINGASLLQSNCTIWLEGPSDRIYLKSWIDAAVVRMDVKPTLVENSDYSFAFYGGSNLSHFRLDQEDETDAHSKELIELTKISRYSAVIMDRDLAPGVDVSKLKPAKRSIIASASDDPVHRAAFVTEGREIENDVIPEDFISGLKQLPSLATKDLSGLVLTGKFRYYDEIKTHVLGIDGTAKLPERIDKVALATAVADLHSGEGVTRSYPKWITELIEFIVRSRLDE